MHGGHLHWHSTRTHQDTRQPHAGTAASPKARRSGPCCWRHLNTPAERVPATRAATPPSFHRAGYLDPPAGPPQGWRPWLSLTECTAARRQRGEGGRRIVHVSRVCLERLHGEGRGGEETLNLLRVTNTYGRERGSRGGHGAPQGAWPQVFCLPSSGVTLLQRTYQTTYKTP